MGVYNGDGIYNHGGITDAEVQALIDENGKGIFYADYNITTRAEVLAAVTAGKQVICRRVNNDQSTDYAFLDFKSDADALEFFAVHDNKIYKYTLDTAGTWAATETAVGGDCNAFFVDNNTYWDDVKEAFDNGKFVYYYQNSWLPDGSLRDHVRLFILSKFYGNTIYFVGIPLNKGTGTQNNFVVDYIYAVRQSGLAKGGLILSNLSYGAFAVIPNMPSRNTGENQVQVIKGINDPSWIRFYGSFLVGDTGAASISYMTGKDSQGQDLVLMRMQVYNQISNNAKKFWGAEKVNNSLTIGLFTIREVPTTSSHYNQILRSGNDGSFGWEQQEFTAEVSHNGSNWVSSLTYDQINTYLNLDRPVKVRIEDPNETNTFYYANLTKRINDGTHAHIIFEFVKYPDSGQIVQASLWRCDFEEGNTFSLTTRALLFNS